jgi:putative tryptophan/tyrosine transport system substrate-binding protein
MLIAGSVFGRPLAARAQQPQGTRRIGVLMAYSESDSEAQSQFAAFVQELQKLGWADQRNLRLDSRWATPTDASAMQRSAKELVALQPDVILSSTTPSTTALLQQTRTIPIVFATVGDPVSSGFVTSFRRPGSNATGFTTVDAPLGGKYLELLKQIAPAVIRAAAIFNPEAAPFIESYMRAVKIAAQSLGVTVNAVAVHDTPPVVNKLAREPNIGLVVMPDSFTLAHRLEITSLAARYRLPAVYPWRNFAEVGGLVSYGPNPTDNFRRAATYVDRILRGEKPSELPVQAPVKLELVINLKTAKTLDLIIPPSLLATADEVIE